MFDVTDFSFGEQISYPTVYDIVQQVSEPILDRVREEVISEVKAQILEAQIQAEVMEVATGGLIDADTLMKGFLGLIGMTLSFTDSLVEENMSSGSYY